MEPGNVTFNTLDGISKADVDVTVEAYKQLCTPEQLADRVLWILMGQKNIYGGAKVDLYEHGLQTATR